MEERWYSVSSFGGSVITLGKAGEGEAVRIEIDVSEWLDDYPNAQLKLYVQPPKPGMPYFAQLDVTNSLVGWTLRKSDTQHAGGGVIELMLLDGEDVLIKSRTARTQLLPSPSTGGASEDPPGVNPAWWEEPIRKINEAVVSAIGEANQAINQHAEAVKQSLPQDYTETYDRAIRNERTKAPVIECEATGAIVTVDDAAAMPVMELIINIDPAKNLAAGRDLKGYDAVTVQRSGKNLFPSGEETFTQQRRVSFGVPLPTGTYTIGALITSNDTDGSTSTISFLDEELETVASVTLNRSAYNRKTITIGREVYSAQMYAGTKRDTSIGDRATWSNIMLTAGSTECDYEPYVGQALTVNLPETVYVGTLDWTGGLLTVESYGLAEFDGSEDFEAPSAENTRTQIFTCAEVKVENKAKWSTNYAKTVSNLFSASAFTTPSYAKLEANTFYWADASGAWRFGWGAPGATIEEFKAFLQANPLKILVPTTTGRKEYQLNTQQIDMVKGYNNVWSNCGNTDITYPADTKIYIDKQFDALAAALIGG